MSRTKRFEIVLLVIDRLIIGVGSVGRKPKEATYTLYNPETDKLTFRTVRYGKTVGFS